MALSKSPDMPIDSSGSGRPVRWRSASRVSRSRTNEGRAVSASVPHAAIVIRPTIRIARQAAIASASSQTCSGDQPCLVSSPEVLTWRQTGGASGSSRARESRRLEQLQRIDRVDHLDHGQGSLRLVRLEVADQVPAHRLSEAAQGLGLPPELLGIVLAQVDSTPPQPAGRTSSTGHFLVTATSVTASGARPDRRAAAAILARTSSRFRRISSRLLSQELLF